jgi:CelD/BcsL family acetyltransferase involved in cellulose biosynthesis
MVRQEVLPDAGTRGVTTAVNATRPTAPAVLVERDIEALTQHVAAWDALAAAAIEPNPCYESWMLLPALRAFGAGTDFRFVLVFQPDPAQPLARPALSGFFPFELRRHFKGLPVRTLALWRHLHCVLGTPLVRAQTARACLDTLRDWLDRDGAGARLVELGFVSGDGPVHQHLIDLCNDGGRLTYLAESFNRALCRRADDAEAYLGVALSAKNRKELRRQRKRLGELGRLECRALDADGDLEDWLDKFFKLESSGWKGRAGTALGERDVERDFFERIARAAFERRRLMMLGLFLDDQPIAIKFNLLAAPGSFAFKIAYDERLARFSPGVQLELANLQSLHALPAIDWMDSWAVANHPMIDRLWTERRTIQTLVWSTGRLGSDLLVSILPLLRWIRRKLSRRKPR